jgi:hypothetical protein
VGGDAADVAGEHARRELLQVGAAAEHEEWAVEEAAVGRVAKVVREGVERRLLVGARHRDRAGDVLHLPARGARGDGEVGHAARPGDVDEIGEAAAPVLVPELPVGPERDALLVVRDGADRGEVVVLAELGAGRSGDERGQLPALGERGVLTRQLVEPVSRVGAQQRG